MKKKITDEQILIEVRRLLKIHKVPGWRVPNHVSLLLGCDAERVRIVAERNYTVLGRESSPRVRATRLRDDAIHSLMLSGYGTGDICKILKASGQKCDAKRVSYVRRLRNVPRTPDPRLAAEAHAAVLDLEDRLGRPLKLILRDAKAHETLHPDLTPDSSVL